jgi:hypothetical protein
MDRSLYGEALGDPEVPATLPRPQHRTTADSDGFPLPALLALTGSRAAEPTTVGPQVLEVGPTCADRPGGIALGLSWGGP